MVQFYFLTVLFLLFSAALLLADKHGSRHLFLINIRDFFSTIRGLRVVYFITGLACVVAKCITPTEPGPGFIGDIIPVLVILLDMIHFLNHDESYVYKNNPLLGTISLVVGIIHFVIPSFVLL